MKVSKKKIVRIFQSISYKIFPNSIFKLILFLRTFKKFKKQINNQKKIEKFSDTKSLINNYEYKITSQNNEDGIIDYIFSKIPNNKYFVEIGFEYYECNTLNLIKKGWAGKLIDFNHEEVSALSSNLFFYYPKSKIQVICKKITKGNINQIINSEKKEIDFFSLDIDGNDYWVLKNLNLDKINVICVEYNHWFGAEKKITMKYNEDSKFTDDGIFGASLLALTELLNDKGFSLIAIESSGTNAFFVKNKFAGSFEILCPKKNFISVGRFYSKVRKLELLNNVKNSLSIEEIN